MRNITLYTKDIHHEVCINTIYVEIELVDGDGNYVATLESCEAYENLYDAIKYALLLNEDGIVDMVNHKLLNRHAVVADSPDYARYKIEFDYCDYLIYKP